MHTECHTQHCVMVIHRIHTRVIPTVQTPVRIRRDREDTDQTMTAGGQMSHSPDPAPVNTVTP